MPESSATLARRLAMLSHARHNRRGRRALLGTAYSEFWWQISLPLEPPLA